MTVNSSVFVNDEQARAFIIDYSGTSSRTVEVVGEGAWSLCYGFRHGQDELVIRFGKHVEDFRKDERAFAFAGPDLPIPEVLDIGHAYDGYYAISRRVYGVPLESVNVAGWRAIVPALVDALEAMRTADLS